MSEMVGVPRILKLLNKDIIEKVIQENGPITKPEIARQTNLSLVTVNKIVETLLSENRIRMSGVNESTGGRRAQSYIINKELNYNIVLLYHRDQLLGIVTNSIGDEIYEKEFPLRTDTYENTMTDTYAAIDGLLEQCGSHEVTAIGIGVPGVVSGGFVTNIPNIPGWEGMNVAEVIEEKYQIRVFLENDINLATMGIYSNEYKDDVDNLLVIYMEKGIGSGIILNKELFKGSSNFAGELSYMPVAMRSTRKGEKRKYKGHLENEIAVISEEMRSCGDKERMEWKELLLKTMRDSLLSIICILNPEIVVIQYEMLEETDMKILEEMLGELIDGENIPKLVKADNLKKHSIRGLIDLCMNNTMSMYSLSKK